MKKIFIPTFFILSLSGCIMAIQDSITKYESVESKIELGYSKSKVLSILNPTQKDLQSNYKKRPEKYIKKEILVEIFYFRTGLQLDGLTTDDEFTPYVFNNGKLVAIGWTAIGGTKSQGQAVPRTNVIVQHSTIIY